MTQIPFKRAEGAEDITILIKILQATNLPPIGVYKRESNALLELIVGKKEDGENVMSFHTEVKTSSNPIWNTEFSIIGIKSSSQIVMEVFDHFAEKKLLGTVTETTIENLFQIASKNGIVKLPFLKGSVTIQIRPDFSSADAIARTFLDLRLKMADVANAPKLPDSESLVVAGSFRTIVQNLETLMNVADGFSKIHPYVNVAWQVVSFVYKVVKSQLDRDDAVLDLLTTMETLYSFVNPLKSILNEKRSLEKSLESVVEAILKQTIECFTFIKEYLGHGFCGRVLRDTISTTDSKITQFKNAFVSLANSFDHALGLQTAFVSLRIELKVDELVLHQRLRPIDTTWSKRPHCHPKTRLKDINDVTDWALNGSKDDPTNVLWVSGLAGSGKSTFATTLANLFSEHRRLGAFLFFDRDMQERSDPVAVIRTLAFELARFDSRINSHVVHATNEFAHISKMQLEAQFQNLIRRPLDLTKDDISKEGPFVIIIDALDECGTVRDRQELVNLLSKATSELPLFIRIIITSRSTPDIESAFSPPQLHVRALTLETSENKDIEVFMEQELTQIAVRHRLAKKSWPTPSDIQKLAQKAGGLWIWASKACRFIDGIYPDEKMKTILSGNSAIKLEDMYIKTLKSLPWDDERFAGDCRTILGIILVAKDPLSSTAIDDFLGLESQYIISELKSLLDRRDEQSPVRMLHASLRDYLSTTSSSNPWLINISDYNQKFAIRCIEVLQGAFITADQLFDIPLNKPVSETHLNNASFKYACCYWTVHICETDTCSQNMEQRISAFLHSNLLHWFQALSIFKKSRGAPGMLFNLQHWMKSHNVKNDSLLELLGDAGRFSAFFADTIAEHPGMVYLSALPFAPLNTKLYKLFHTDRSNLPIVLGGYQRYWSPFLRVFRPRLKARERDMYANIYSLALSPDGSKLAVSAGPGAILGASCYLRVWDVMSGVESLPMTKIDAPSVVTFSSDGSEMWSASELGTVCILNAETGNLVSELSQRDWTLAAKTVEMKTKPKKLHHTKKSQQDGHDQESNTPLLTFPRAAINTSNSIVIFGSDDGGLRVIDTKVLKKEQYHALKSNPLKRLDRKFRTICFSPVSSQFSSASGDGVIYVWNTETGKQIVSLEGHSAEVTALAYTRDGQRLISASEDGSIRVWDIAMSQTVSCAMVEPKSGFFPLGISPDGEKVVSTSKDGTLKFWTVASGLESGPVLQGHFNAVSAVEFSPAGSTLYSGAYLNGVHMWDISNEGHADRIQRHERPARQVKFSPDGLLVRSSRDGETKFWDSASGRELRMEPYDETAHFIVPKDMEGVKSGEHSAHVRAGSGKGEIIRLFYADSDVEWKPDLSDSDSISLSSCRFKCSEKGEVTFDGELIWKLPLELMHRSHDFHRNNMAIGMWDGRICIVSFQRLLADYLKRSQMLNDFTT